MLCPKCGKQYNSKYRNCPHCILNEISGKNKKNKPKRIHNNSRDKPTSSINDITKFQKPKNRIKNKSRNINKRYYLDRSSNNSKKKPTIDPSNVNGYQVGEGMSINGRKLRKGSRTSRDAIIYSPWMYSE
ncbi:hypothetical protein [uncultured Methanobrevibacter sp.]|uniref:hypothetical protein n=1 Tax=uncultured Methanobrevibacter sp. TaxID=253161 RepID=UPI0025ECC501|nr:hypothetical protein [uncultured Methanobrevibacter sp.]